MNIHMVEVYKAMCKGRAQTFRVLVRHATLLVPASSMC